MEALGRILVLVLVFVVVVAAAVFEEQALTVDQLSARLKENGCLPDDVTSLGVDVCRNEAGLTQELLCIASSSGIAGDYGYDPTAGDAYIDGLSSDEIWTTQQKEWMANCSSMTLDQVPADKEGTFVLACWHQLLISDCGRKKMTALVEAVEPEGAKDLVDAIADLAEGPCFDVGLKYAEELGVKWGSCAAKNKLEMDVLNGAAYHYILFSRGENIPNATVENNALAREQLRRLNATVHCYAVSTGEVTEEGNVNYDLINESTRNATGREVFKVVDRAFVDYCRSQNPAGIDEFYTCFSEQKPFACAVLKSYDVALGRQAMSGASAMETSVATPTAAGILAGILGSIF